MIRQAKHSDLEGLIKLYAHLNKDDSAQNKDILEETWKEIINNQQYFVYFVKIIEGNIVASCTITVIPNLTRSCHPYGLIENVVTHKDYRQRGYGTEILGHALRYAWEKNCYKVMLLTGSKRPETLRFYTKNGFLAGAKTGFVAYPSSQPI